MQDQTAASTLTTKSEVVSAKPRTHRPTRAHYVRIHAKPLPLEVFPLPAFVPHNPLSLFRILSALLGEMISQKQSHSSARYSGYLSLETRSVHITDSQHIRALWEMGFFGKGSLSRSEPQWLQREQAKLGLAEDRSAEKVRDKRRKERKLMKLERARLEREAIEEQLRREGKLDVSSTTTHVDGAKDSVLLKQVTWSEKQSIIQLKDSAAPKHDKEDRSIISSIVDESLDSAINESLREDAIRNVQDEEHLQLHFCEAFFLVYGLGVLSIAEWPGREDHSNHWSPLDAADLLGTFARYSLFPPLAKASSVQPDNPFLLSYVVYHHYRSLGWVPRLGIKFACDWLIYARGPALDHAEFAIIIIPEYSSNTGGNEVGGAQRRLEQQKWWEMHCVNRVQSQVFKTLVLCYVELPSTVQVDSCDIGSLLRSYKLREFTVKRWLANRSRD